jgi:hypothetical protein
MPAETIADRLRDECEALKRENAELIAALTKINVLTRRSDFGSAEVLGTICEIAFHALTKDRRK